MKHVRFLLLFLFAVLLSGCYFMQAAQGEMSLLAHRKPIAKILADPATTSTLKSRLEYVQAARDFASHELGLPDNRSYRSYVDLQRPYVLWNVFAAPEFSIDPKQWCFPVAGCVVYRGYFRETAAKRYADKLRSKGFDVAVTGVPAYSTLGHFNDPVLSSMMHWSNAQVAATLFHELAHQVVYVKDDSSFNEAFATVVASEGMKRWLLQHDNPAALDAWQTQQQRSVEFSALLLATREKLRAVYASGQSAGQMRKQKQQVFDQLRESYLQLRQRWNGDASYDAWINRPLNNADFVAVDTYQRCVPAFEHLLRSVNDNLPEFYAQVKSIAHDKDRQRHFCQLRWGATSLPSSPR